jgi:hypothetical protein
MSKKLTPAILNKLIMEVMNEKGIQTPDSDDPTQHPKYIEVEPERDTSKLVGIQKKYMEFINELTPEERKQMKQLFCYDMFSLDKINSLALASKGKIEG